jgi:hypothetical protein
MATDDRTSGIQHTHVFAAESAVPRLQSAHDVLRWDVSKSRLLSFSVCSICGTIDRASITECTVDGCTEHGACRRPYK